MPPAVTAESDNTLANRDTLKNLITGFGWRGRRGLSAEVGAHPNDFLLYAFFGSMKNVGVALRTVLRGKTEPVILIGDTGRIAPVSAALQSGGISVKVVGWHYGEPAPLVSTSGHLILCEIPQTYSDYTSLFELREKCRKFSTLWELTLPLSVMLEVMLLLDYNVGANDQINKVPETLAAHEGYFEHMCNIYAALVPGLNPALDVKDKTVLEFGPADGIHTGFLVASGARQVTAVEGRPENVVKLLAAQYAFGWRNVEIFTDNFQYPGPWASRRYDLVYAHGVVYHCQNPFPFMELMIQLSDKIFLGGWVATETRPRSRWLNAEYGGRSYRVQVYEEPAHFLAGLATTSIFLSAEGVEEFFRDRGYRAELLGTAPLRAEGFTDSFCTWIFTRDAQHGERRLPRIEGQRGKAERGESLNSVELTRAAEKAMREGRTSHPRLQVNGYHDTGYNIVECNEKFWGVHQSEGPFDVEKFDGGPTVRPVYVGSSIEEVAAQIDAGRSPGQFGAARSTRSEPNSPGGRQA
ncbi:MAG: class I SAM-dependent methyltransferase [Alphaproteobacteria bacterium]|nr:class I SAM-dependent methyltransferase [Alphaproteobacteria bacterium]